MEKKFNLVVNEKELKQLRLGLGHRELYLDSKDQSDDRLSIWEQLNTVYDLRATLANIQAEERHCFILRNRDMYYIKLALRNAIFDFKRELTDCPKADTRRSIKDVIAIYSEIEKKLRGGKEDE